MDGLIITHDYKLQTRPSPEKWEEILDVDEGSVYHRRNGTMNDVREVGNPEPGVEIKVRLVENTRQRVVADVEVPGWRKNAVALSFRRPYFNGYRATLDDRTLEVSSQDGLMPTVTLPPGSRGRLTLRYFPQALIYGIELAIGGLVLATSLAVLALKRPSIASSVGKG